MLRSQRPGNNGSDGMDEHNQPTEPMPPLVLPASPVATPGIATSMPSPADPTIAVSPAYGMPDAYPYPSPAQYPIQGGQQPYPVYPILPPQAAQQSIPMAGGATGSQFHPGEALGQFLKITFWIIFTQRRLIPMLVGGFFVAVELVLLARAILTFIGRFTFVPRQIAIETVSDVFLFPIQLLVQALHLPVPIGIEISCLLALPFYLLLSRLLVRTLKVLLGVYNQQATSTSGKASQKP